MNNRGFTLIETILTITIITVIFLSFFAIVSNTLSITDEKSYDVMKKNIISQVNDYIIECDNKLIDCDEDYIWKEYDNEKETSFNLDVMRKYSYFNTEDYINPITKEDIGNCLMINIKKDELSNISILLDDTNCLKN